MPRSEQAYEEIRERTSTRILEAAAKVIARKGLGATMADVAAEAGVSQGLAYRYFPSKEAIFYTLLRRMLQSGSMTNASAKSEGRPRERLEHIISGVIRMRREKPQFYRFVFQALMDENLPDDIRRTLSSNGMNARKVMRQLIIEGQSKGEVSKGDPDELVDVILDCLEGLSMRMAHSSPGDRLRIPDAEVILRVLGPSQPGGEE